MSLLIDSHRRRHEIKISLKNRPKYISIRRRKAEANRRTESWNVQKVHFVDLSILGLVYYSGYRNGNFFSFHSPIWFDVIKTHLKVEEIVRHIVPPHTGATDVPCYAAENGLRITQSTWTHSSVTYHNNATSLVRYEWDSNLKIYAIRKWNEWKCPLSHCPIDRFDCRIAMRVVLVMYVDQTFEFPSSLELTQLSDALPSVACDRTCGFVFVCDQRWL